MWSLLCVQGGCKFCVGLCVYARRGLKRHRHPCCYFYLKIAPQTRQSTVCQGQLFSQHSMRSGSRENSPSPHTHTPHPALSSCWRPAGDLLETSKGKSSRSWMFFTPQIKMGRYKHFKWYHGMENSRHMLASLWTRGWCKTVHNKCVSECVGLRVLVVREGCYRLRVIEFAAYFSLLHYTSLLRLFVHPTIAQHRTNPINQHWYQPQY